MRRPAPETAANVSHRLTLWDGTTAVSPSMDMSLAVDFFAQQYVMAREQPSDIFLHLGFLSSLGASVSSITEMGVRAGISTRAFLAGMRDQRFHPPAAAAAAELTLTDIDIAAAPPFFVRAAGEAKAFNISMVYLEVRVRGVCGVCSVVCK